MAHKEARERNEKMVAKHERLMERKLELVAAIETLESELFNVRKESSARMMGREFGVSTSHAARIISGRA